MVNDSEPEMAREDVDHYDDLDDPLVWLRDAIGHAEDSYEQGVLNRAHNKILEYRKKGIQHWICPVCGAAFRAREKPDHCHECGEWGEELTHLVVNDVE